MYVVSELTGKRYATVDECARDERAYRDKKEAERIEKEKLQKKFDEAWEGVIKALDNFAKVANEVEPNSSDVKELINLLKMF